jgi:hypothetical protein
MYVLEADAALAYDKTVEALHLEYVRQKNFITSADYESTRQAELNNLESRGVCIDDVGSLEEVAYYIDCIVPGKCKFTKTHSAQTDASEKKQLLTRQAKRKAPVGEVGTFERLKQQTNASVLSGAHDPPFSNTTIKLDAAAYIALSKHFTSLLKSYVEPQTDAAEQQQKMCRVNDAGDDAPVRGKHVCESQDQIATQTSY